MIPISLEDIVLRVGATEVLAGLSLEVGPGEIVAIMGPSGGGKTSLLRVILGFLAPERGTVWLNGTEATRDGRVLRLPEERGLAVVFQDLALWPHLSVHGNLAFGLAAKGVGRQDREARIAAMLAKVGLAGKANRLPGDLSGGERQRVAIARALILDPVAVLLDEPMANLDMALRRELLAVFHGLLKERGASAVYVTHDPREAARIADRVAILGGGKIVQAGAFEDLRRRPADPMVTAVIADL